MGRVPTAVRLPKISVMNVLFLCAGALFALVFHAAPTPFPGVPVTGAAYSVDADRLRQTGQPALASAFVRSAPDAALRRFLAESAEASATWPRRVLMLAKTHLFFALQRYGGWSRPDASGLLGMATLFVASEAQLRTVAAGAAAPSGARASRPSLLDVGAGAGHVTARLAAALGVRAADVTCLESAGSLRASLRARGFRAAASPSELGGGRFSVAALLSVLDRCDDPAALLRAAASRVAPGGLLLIGVALPFRTLVHEGRFGSTWGVGHSRPPRHPLRVSPPSSSDPVPFEAWVAALVETVRALQPGLELDSWTRLPYVSSGDTAHTHYLLDTALITFRVPERHAPGALGSVAGAALPPQCDARHDDDVYTWLASTLESSSARRGWGDVLDAGTGLGSMCWLLRRERRTLLAVTASRDGTYGEVELRRATAGVPSVEVRHGNWRNRAFMQGRSFDVVVADYLLGAVEQHWRYGAGELLERLLGALRPGGYLLLAGLEPYELVLDRLADPQDRLVLDIEAIGDAAAALAGKATYRELPEQWVRGELARRPALRIVATQHFPMQLTAVSLGRQVGFARKMAESIADRGLQNAMVRRIDQLGDSLKGWRSAASVHDRARNYAMVIQRVPSGGAGESARSVCGESPPATGNLPLPE